MSEKGKKKEAPVWKNQTMTITFNGGDIEDKLLYKRLVGGAQMNEVSISCYAKEVLKDGFTFIFEWPQLNNFLLDQREKIELLSIVLAAKIRGKTLPKGVSVRWEQGKKHLLLIDEESEHYLSLMDKRSLTEKKKDFLEYRAKEREIAHNISGVGKKMKKAEKGAIRIYRGKPQSTEEKK